MKTFYLILFATVAAALNPPAQGRNETISVSPTQSRCLSVTEGDKRLLLASAVQFATDEATNGLRANFRVALVHEDSVQIYEHSESCAKADSSYRVWRVSKGKPDKDLKVALARLGSTGYYFALASSLIFRLSASL